MAKKKTKKKVNRERKEKKRRGGRRKRPLNVVQSTCPRFLPPFSKILWKQSGMEMAFVDCLYFFFFFLLSCLLGTHQKGIVNRKAMGNCILALWLLLCCIFNIFLTHESLHPTQTYQTQKWMQSWTKETEWAIGHENERYQKRDVLRIAKSSNAF